MEILLDLEENFKGKGLCFQKGFYSAQEKVTIVLTKHFDYLCNDDCLVGGRTTITTLGDLQVPSEDML